MTSKLAYFDTFTGLIPCKVTGIRVYNEFGHYEVTFTLTATRGAYRRGETLSARPLYVIPRKNITVRNGQYHIKADYSWAWVSHS